ncbi:DUF3466 family protein [Vibrio hannami]|uniref:DUF3466 family protein n=1 Tax=Vibrio hannami TaxID=2717094 RepID=UPI0024100030|nr:DUF3466 family protein [Vibrio hannami]MDG3085894.1 DUF3466 family protein [Vibrio hannami]
MKVLSARPVVVLLSTFSTFYAESALYRVVEVGSPTQTEESYGIAIEKETGIKDCFSDSCSESTYEVAGDTLNATEGFSLKEEVMFDLDDGFTYLDYDDLYSYCSSELGYSTCEAWAYFHWYGDTDSGIGGLRNEREAYWEASYQTNATAFFSGYTLTFEPDSGTNAPSISSYSYQFVDGTEEKVVNAVDEDSYVIGNTSSGYYNYGGQYIRVYRSRGYYSTSSTEVVLEPEVETGLTLTDETAEQYMVEQMGTTSAYDSFTYGGKKYVVGSSAVAPFYYDDDDKDYDSENTSDSDYESVANCTDEYDSDGTEPSLQPECQNYGFATKAFIWNITDGPNNDLYRFSVSDWDTDSTYYEYDYYYDAAQASVRAAAISNTGTYSSLPVLVGYNSTYDDDYYSFRMQAAVFRPSNTTSFTVEDEAWETVFIDNVDIEGSSYIYSNSMATDINENMLVIGHAKRDGDYPSNGVTDKRMFIADASDDTPSAVFFENQSEDIFFSSAAGNANAINNYNEIVGQVDAENNDEVDGKQRDHRGFIYPYDDYGTDDTRRARFSNQAWWLDDLTNGGDYSSANNHFRIIDAGDINDAGVISATAIQCYADESATSSMEYDSTEHFAYCNEGSGDERIVAVVLVPIQGATSDDISEREDDTSTVSRSGAGLGWYMLISLFSIGFIRRKSNVSPYSN